MTDMVAIYFILYYSLLGLTLIDYFYVLSLSRVTRGSEIICLRTEKKGSNGHWGWTDQAA